MPFSSMVVVKILGLKEVLKLSSTSIEDKETTVGGLMNTLEVNARVRQPLLSHVHRFLRGCKCVNDLSEGPMLSEVGRRWIGPITTN